MEHDQQQEDRIIQNNQFKEKIKAMKSQFFAALDDFKKYYVYYNKNPEVDEFQNNYENSKSQLQTLSDQLLRTTYSINNHIDKLDADMSDITEQIEKEKERNIKLTYALNNLEKTQNGSEVLIDDYKEKYNIQYYKNVQLYYGILIIITILAVLSGNPFLLKLLKYVIFLSTIVLIYNLSLLYSYILFILFIAIVVAIIVFWK